MPRRLPLLTIYSYSKGQLWKNVRVVPFSILKDERGTISVKVVYKQATHLVSRDIPSSVEGMFFARAMRVRTTECLCWGSIVGFEIKLAVGVSSFPVDRHGDRAILLSGCFGVKKVNVAFWFYLDRKFDLRVDGIGMWVELVSVFPFYTHMAVIYLSKPPFGRVSRRWKSFS